VWVHGDLHPANAVISGGTLAGVFDSGRHVRRRPGPGLSGRLGPAAGDAAGRFFAAYAQADEATIRRARGLAALKSLFLMLMGQNGDRGLPAASPPEGRRHSTGS
jgi:aminoglycoside phosphotransferase (APT) family kinase protein